MNSACFGDLGLLCGDLGLASSDLGLVLQCTNKSVYATSTQFCDRRMDVISQVTCPRGCVINLERYVTKRLLLDDLSHIYLKFLFVVHALNMNR